MGVDLDLSKVKIPQILQILQILWEISDEEAISWLNMWVPYALVCEESSVEAIINEAKKNWKQALRWGTVVRGNSTISWVWIGKSKITI